VIGALFDVLGSAPADVVYFALFGLLLVVALLDRLNVWRAR
jgi:hypothetical protein